MLHSESSLWFHYNQNEKWRGVTESLKFYFSLGLELFKTKKLISFFLPHVRQKKSQSQFF